MSNFFSMESPLNRFLTRLADIMILNLLFIITSIPIITIGASWTAMSYVLLKMVRNEESYIVKGYFKSFKQNFRQATIIWVFCLLAACLMFVDFRIINAMDGSLKTFMQSALSAIGLLIGIIVMYVFPVLSKFENSILHTIKNSLIMAICNLPRTLAIVAISLGCPFITFLNTTTFTYGLLVWVLFGFALIGYVNSMHFVKIFDKYIPTEEEGPKEAVSIDSSVFQNLHPVEGPISDEEEAADNQKLSDR